MAYSSIAHMGYALIGLAAGTELGVKSILVLLFSLAGVPPMLGFFAKLGVWQAGVDAGQVWLVVASAVASAIGAYYYLRIVFLMYFGAEGDDRLDEGKSNLLSGFVV